MIWDKTNIGTVQEKIYLADTDLSQEIIDIGNDIRTSQETEVIDADIVSLEERIDNKNDNDTSQEIKDRKDDNDTPQEIKDRKYDNDTPQEIIDRKDDNGTSQEIKDIKDENDTPQETKEKTDTDRDTGTQQEDIDETHQQNHLHPIKQMISNKINDNGIYSYDHTGQLLLSGDIEINPGPKKSKIGRNPLMANKTKSPPQQKQKQIIIDISNADTDYSPPTKYYHNRNKYWNKSTRK